MTQKRIRCSICGGKIDIEPVSGWAKGHNAWPINNDRCCGDCNATVVLPKRLEIMSKANHDR